MLFDWLYQIELPTGYIIKCIHVRVNEISISSGEIAADRVAEFNFVHVLQIGSFSQFPSTWCTENTEIDNLRRKEVI